MKRTENLGEFLKARREGLGLTQRSLAQKLGVEASHVAFIESGRRKPSLKLVARLADSIGVDRQTRMEELERRSVRICGKSEKNKRQMELVNGCVKRAHWRNQGSDEI